MKNLIPWKRRQRDITSFDKNKDDLFNSFFNMPMDFGRSLFSDKTWDPNVDAKYKNGILKLKLKKVKDAETKTITVKTS